VGFWSVWVVEVFGVGRYIHLCVCAGVLAAKDVRVFAPPTVRSKEQVAVAKSFSRHLYFNELTFITLLDLSIRSSNHVSVDDCPALCNEGTTVRVMVCRHPDECEC